MENMKFNKCQTPLEELELGKYPKEVQDNFLEFLNTVPFIRWMVSPDRPLVSELPRDSEGKAIIDVTHPPILENSDYFRHTAKVWEATGSYTNLRPNRNPNSDFGKWIREERKRGWEGCVDPSTGMWVTGDYYWMLNYCPMHLIEKRKDGLTMRVVKFPKFWDGQFLASHYFYMARLHGHHAAELASRGKGKAHPYSQIVYTPTGVRQWGDIKIGDLLFGDDGNLTRVTKIPFDEEEDIYTVTLADGRSFECTSGHLFYVRDSRKFPTMEVVSLGDIMYAGYTHQMEDGSTEYYYSIPNNKKVEFDAHEVLIDPYTLGLLLGGGSLIKSDNADTNNFNLKGFLQEYGLSYCTSDNQFIPKDYLFNTSYIRFSLLQGLMDAGGTLNNAGTPQYSTTSSRLAEDIRWLCHSLGYNSTMTTTKADKKTYTVTLLTDAAVFRKADKLKGLKPCDNSEKDWTRIVNIKYSHREKAKCVIVDNDSHCYLIGNFIVTHNTALGAAMLSKRFIIGEFENNKTEIQCLVTAADRVKLAGTNQILSVFVDNIDFCAKNTQFASRRLKSSKQELSWKMGYKKSGIDVEYGSKNEVTGIIAGVNQDKLNGSRGVLYIIEEAGIFKDLLSTYNMIRPSVEQGSSVFGEIIGYGCVCAGTKVLDENGMIHNIEDIQLGDKLLGYDGTQMSTEDITYIQGEAYKDCVRVTASNGNTLECSTDHPLLALNTKKGPAPYKSCSFYKAEELESGMVLLMPKCLNKPEVSEGVDVTDTPLQFVLRDNGKGKYFEGKELANLVGIPVDKVEHIGMRRIYNLTANTTHTYITNGFISSNTAGDDMSDFTAFSEMINSPEGYNMEPLDNVFDKEGQGRQKITIFYPAYMNYDDSCMDENGNSDVTKALLALCNDRYKVKYGSTDINTITKRITQYPITPQEAVVRSRGSVFPVTELTERLNQIDRNPSFYDDVYIGELSMEGKTGEVKFNTTTALPIRDFPLKDNKDIGALEIYQMPQKNSDGKVPSGRYILSLDPFDNDTSNTLSLGSLLVLDLWTDRIVAEYTGRPKFADDLYEIARRACLFYNGKLMYEAHPYSQKVITPDGIKLWKDIKIGDRLFSTNGRIVKVIAIPIDEYMPIYKVSLVDGREIMCSDNHIWTVYKGNDFDKSKLSNMTVMQMLEEGVRNKWNHPNFFIPNGGTVEYPHKDVPLNPYTLGLLLAKGTFTRLCTVKSAFKTPNKTQGTISFPVGRKDADFYKTVIPYQIKSTGSKDFCCHVYIDDIDKILDDLGLLCEGNPAEFIPDLYKYNDYQTRLELLKGLMDGNGYIGNTGTSIYTTTSEKLREDIMELCRSIGINCSYRKQPGRETSNPTKGKAYSSKASFKIMLYTDMCLFKLPRKADRRYKHPYPTKESKASSLMLKTAIESIAFSHYEQGKCITVDSDDGLYMVGDYVVTHNCNIKGTFAYFSRMNSTYLLAETPEYLQDKQLIKSVGYGNTAFGIRAVAPVIDYAFKLIRDWLLKPTVKIEKDSEGNDVETTVPNLYNIRNRALLKELILWNPNINTDRVMSLAQAMLYREEKMIMYRGNMNDSESSSSDMDKDDYWSKNYPGRPSERKGRPNPWSTGGLMVF